MGRRRLCCGGVASDRDLDVAIDLWMRILGAAEISSINSELHVILHAARAICLRFPVGITG